MQLSYRHHLLTACLIASAVATGCYPHAGQSHRADADRWYEHAVDACQRGDETAYTAFIERSDVASDDLRCHDRTVHHDTISDGTD